MGPILIRQADASDINAILQLEQQWAEENITFGFIPQEEAHLQQCLGPYFLVAELDGKIIAFISGSTHFSEGMAVIPEGTSYLEIDNLYVAPAYRQNKIGSQLIEHLLETARREGYSKVLLYSASKDIHRILKFYEALGFQSWYVQMFKDL